MKQMQEHDKCILNVRVVRMRKCAMMILLVTHSMIALNDCEASCISGCPSISYTASLPQLSLCIIFFTEKTKTITAKVVLIMPCFFLFSGHKYQKTALFLVGFSGGALFTYVICIVRSTLLIYYILLITALIAILLGILCTTIVFCGLFAVGLGAGMCLSIAFLLAFSHLYAYETLSIPIGVVIGTSVLMAGATVWWKRVLLIISSSIYGGALIMGPVDYFVEDFWLLDYAWRKAFLVKYSGEPCLFSWIILGVWPLMSLVGLLVQFLKTGKRPPKRKKGEHHHRRHYHMRHCPVEDSVCWFISCKVDILDAHIPLSELSKVGIPPESCWAIDPYTWECYFKLWHQDHHNDCSVLSQIAMCSHFLTVFNLATIGVWLQFYTNLFPTQDMHLLTGKRHNS